jgi:hypothetical protein
LTVRDAETGLDLATSEGPGPGFVSFATNEGTAIFRVTYDLDLNDMYRRGYLNGDPALDIGDAVFGLRHLFQGGEAPSCPAAFDINADGFEDISDPVFLLNFLFLGGLRPTEPFENPERCPSAD